MDKIKINYKYLIIYISLISYLLLSKLILIPYFKSDYNEFINPLFWTFLFGICLFLKRTEEKRIKSESEKIQKLTIVVISFYLIYFSVGLFIGYAYSIYSKTIVGILKNIIFYVLPKIFETFILCKLVFEAKKNKLLYVLIFIIFVSINIDYRYIISIATREELFKYFISNVFVTCLRYLVIMYLAYISSYKGCLIYVLPPLIIQYVVPILPNYDWFFTMFVEFILATVIYIVIHKVEKRTESYDNIKRLKKYNRFFRILFIITLFLIVLFVAGAFRYKPIAVVSNSMVPTFQRGDAVVIRKLKANEKKNIEVGQIIAYNYDKRIIIHRVIEKYEDNYGKISYITQGDNNDAKDPTILEDNIIGIVKFKILYVGYPSVWLYEFLR